MRGASTPSAIWLAALTWAAFGLSQALADAAGAAAVLPPLAENLYISETRCGEFCSFKHVTSYVGPIDNNKQLSEALEKLTYKKELIITQHSQPPLAHQALRRVQRAGYYHTMIILTHQIACRKLEPALQKLGCVWYADGSNIQWMLRGWATKFQFSLTLARAVRLGYNVLAMDTDSAAVGDFYKYVKSPPFKNITMLAQREGGNNLNSGFYYIQNAAKTGPVAYALFNHVFMNARWYECSPCAELFTKLNLKHPKWTCNHQRSLSDVVHAMLVGRPWFNECFFFEHRAIDKNNTRYWDKAHLAYYIEIQKKRLEGRGNITVHDKLRHIPPPYEGALITMPPEFEHGRFGPDGKLPPGGDPRVLISAPAYFPHFQGVWPQEFGGNLFAFEKGLGPQAQHIMSLFNETGDPFWPNPEDPSTLEQTRAIPPERFGYFPSWFLNCYWGGNFGVEGWWNVHITQRLPGVMTHVHAGLPPGDFVKYTTMAVAMPFGWDWDLAGKVDSHVSGGQYLANEAHRHLPGIVAYTPDVLRVHRATLTFPQYSKALRELLKVAMLTGRIVGWPWAPCEVPWLRKDKAVYDPIRQGRHKIPWEDYINMTYNTVQSPPTADLTHLNCLSSFLNKRGCVLGGMHHGGSASSPRGLLPVEFDHWLSKQLGSVREPHPENTLPVPGAPAPSADRPIHFQLMQAADVQAARQRFEAQPVLWLDRLVELGPMPEEQEKMMEGITSLCCALKDEPDVHNCLYREQRRPASSKDVFS